MKLKHTLFCASIALATSPAYADVDLFGGKVKAGGYFAQHWQSPIEVEGSAANPLDTKADSGFARLRFGLWFAGQITEDFSFFVELAEEPNDQGDGNYQITQDLAWVDYKVNNDIIFRVGNVVETTMNFLRYSDGGAVQGNPLIGNGSNDMITAAEGVWLLGSHDVALGTWDWNATITKPSFFGDASNGSGYDFGLRSSLVTDSGFGIGAGYFKTTGDTVCATPTNCVLSDGGAFGSLIALGDGDNYDFGSKTLNGRVTQAGIIPAIKADIWQIDAMYETEALGGKATIHGFYGQGRDDFSWAGGSFVASPTTFSQVNAKQDFWGIFGRLDLTETIYVSTRYTVSINETTGIGPGDDELDRIQVGAGWWVDDGVLIKAEYVQQNEGSVSGGGRCTFGGASDCEWEGFIMEGSVSF
jgi:hypothetical protein